MAAFDEHAVRAAREALLRLPGVHGVSRGFRINSTGITAEPVLSVYVWQKKPLAELAPDDVIPPEIGGMRTDVLEADAPQPAELGMPQVETDQQLAEPPLTVLGIHDDKSHAELRGGISCSVRSPGTMGCLARVTSEDAENAGKYVFITAQHVLYANEGRVYQPDRSCFCCGRHIGDVLRGENTATIGYLRKNKNTATTIDAGLLLLRPGEKCLAEILVDPGKPNLRVRDLLPVDQIEKGLITFKRGMRTGPTAGFVFDPHDDWKDPKGNDADREYRNQIRVFPQVPDTVKDGDTIRFMSSGDSGAALMTGDERIVGILWGTQVVRVTVRMMKLKLVAGLATDIWFVQSKLKVEVSTTSDFDKVITVPDTNTLPPKKTKSVGAFEPVPPPMPAATRMLLERARGEVEATERGRAYAAIVRRHHDEVRTLVRTNRRVGAIWKRYGGQRILQAVLDAVGRPDAPIPAAVGNRPLAECAARIAGVLRRYGSAALARDAAAYEHLVSAMSGRTYNQLLFSLRQGTTTPM